MITTDKKLSNNGYHPAAQALQSSLQLLPLIMNNIPQAVFWKDRNLVYLGCNQAFADDAGFSSPDEIIGKTDFDMPWKEQADLYRADDRLVMEGGVAKLNYEEPQTTPDGSRTWLRTNKIPVQENGETVAVLGMYEDITAYKKVHEASEVEKRRFHMILETVRVPTIISRLSDGSVLYANQALADISQVPLEKLVGFKTGSFYVNPDDRETVIMALQQQGHIEDLEVQFQRPDKSTYWALLSSCIIDYEGEKCVLSTYVDINRRKQAETDLLLRDRALASSLNGVFIASLDGKALYANDTFLKMSGYTYEEALQLTGTELSTYGPEDLEKLQSAIFTQGFFVGETLSKRKDGTTFPVDFSASIIRNAEGQPVAIQSVFIDITERKRAEVLLKQNEATLSSALHIAQMGHWEFDLATGLFTLNDQYYSLHGMTAEQVGGYQMNVQRFAQEFVYPEDAAIVGQATQQAIETTDPNFQVRTEARILHADGKPRWVTVWFRTEKDAQGRTIKLHGVNQDITERKQAEAEIKREKSLSDAIINGLPGIFYLFDPEGKLIRWNKQYEQVLSYTTEEIATKNALDPIADEDKERTVAAIQQAFVEGQGSVEADLITRDGRRIPYYFVGQRLQLGDQLYLAGTGIDISERKRLQAQVQEAFERRGLQVQLSTQVSQSIAAASSLDELYERVVTQVKEKFGYYHTQLLRYDTAQQAVMLVTGYGEIGAKMLAAGHRLPMGEGLIGTAASTGNTVLRPTLENDLNWQPNPLLPDTKGEIAVPIKLGDTILGVLDVQSDMAGALDADDQLLLEGLCGQIATAIDSTRLHQEMAERLEEINRLYRAMSHEGWQSYRETAGIPSSFMFDQGVLKPVQDDGLVEELFAKVPLTVPGGETIGTLAIADDPQRPISADDQSFVEQVAEQVALALESARLFEQTQAALVESEETQKLIRNVIDSTDDWIFVKDRQHRYQLVNQGYAKALHIPTDDFIGKTDLDLGFPEEMVKGNPEKGIRGFWTDDLLVMDTGLPQHFPDDPAMIDGQVRIFDTIKIPLRDASGTIWGVLAFSRDLTDRKHAEQIIAQRAIQLETVAKVSTTTSTVLNPNELLQSVVDLTKERFGLYHAHIYLLDPEENALVLTAGSGEVGKQMLAEGWSIPTDHELSIIADAYRDRQSVVANDVYHDKESSFLSNKLLPDTRSEMALPLIVGDRVLGVFDVQSDKVNYFTSEDINIYTTLASQVAVTLQNARLFDQTQEALNWQQAINQTSIMIGQARTVEDIVRATAELLPLLGMLSCSVSIVTETDSGGIPTLCDIHIIRFVDNQFISMPPVLGQSTVGWLPDEAKYYQENRVTVFPNLEDLTTIVPSTAYKAEAAVEYMLKVGMRSAIALALGVHKRAIGYLTFTSRTPLVHIPEKYISWLGSVVDLISAAIDNQLLFGETERGRQALSRRAAELATVANVSTTVSTVLDPDQLLQSVVDLTKEKFDLYHVHIYLANESWDNLLLASGAGEVGRKLVAEQHAIPIGLEQSLVARAARERKAVIVNNVDAEPGFLPNPLLPETCAEMAVPMSVGNKLLGVFDVQSNNKSGFSEADANIYVTLATQVGVALQNARLYVEQAATLTQLRELDKLKSSFLANMSHELRTPLNSILGFTDVIMEGLDGPLTDYMNNDLRLIQKNGQHLLHLINDVLDMAKIEAGRMNLNPESFRAYEVMEEVTSITSTLASEKNLSLFIAEESDRAIKIYADRTRLRQVMINLVNNSIKFTDAGQIVLGVAPMDGARILITVKDTGLGIPPEKLEAIFQEFIQVDSSTTRKTGGTGLGLPISRRLVEMHGGRLWAESTGIPGEGSVFFVELPVEARITEVVEKQEK